MPAGGNQSSNPGQRVMPRERASLAGVRLRWPLVRVSVALVGAVACGGNVQNGDAVTGGGNGATGSSTGGGATSTDGGVLGQGGASSTTDGGLSDVRYVDPGCPPAMKIQGTHACDPFDPSPDMQCGAGYRCIPYVRYADKCHTEEIGTECQPSGTGVQGDDCSVADCAAGFVCVTAGTGFQCASLCRLLPNGDTCTSGLLCTPLDVDGFFVCG